MGGAHLLTPQKARIQGTCDFLDKHGIPYSHNDVFKFHGASKATGWRILAQPRIQDSRTLHHPLRHPDARGRKRKITPEMLAQIERFIDNQFDGCAIPWASLPSAAGLDVDVSAQTVRRAVKDLNLRVCIVCEKTYTSPTLRERRREYARTMLEKYPDPQDWRHIRFSGKCQFARGAQGQVWVLRRPWERHCADCVPEKDTPAETDLKRRLHCWAAVGYDFKSDLVWYDVQNSIRGKMPLQVYRDQILKPVVGQWLRDGHAFVLEEDEDLGHSSSKSNVVRTWRTRNGLDSFINCASSPDFIPIEKAWQGLKQHVLRKQPCFDDSAVREHAEAAWASVSQERINKWVDSIPQILKDCLESDGGMTSS